MAFAAKTGSGLDLSGRRPADNLALTYAILGDHETARSLVEDRLQARPGALTIPLMRLDPRWRGFVESPEFGELADDLGSLR